MAQHGGFNHFGGSHNGGNVDPNDLAAMSSNQFVAASYSNNFNGNSNPNAFDDDELLDTLPMTDGLSRMPIQGIYTGGSNGMSLDQSYMNGYSNTPDGDPIQSPYVPGFNQGYRQSFANPMASPVSFSGSPLAHSEMHDGSDPNYLNAKSQSYMSPAMQRKHSNTQNTMTSKMPAAMSALTMSPRESGNFGAQPIPNGHEKSPSGQWMNTPNSMVHSMGQSLGSSNLGYSSFNQHGLPNVPISEMMKAGTSMPAKLSAPSAVSTQEMKKKKRRESHNAVERRRRDNINDRIQDLSRLVPLHRLEDEKFRKAVANANGTLPEGHATSGLAAPGARRATGAGTITTGLPVDDKEKGPNKGDILNGAVSWTKDLMWLLSLKLQQNEELVNRIQQIEGKRPFLESNDERRMTYELGLIFDKNPAESFAYSRSKDTKLFVPKYTDQYGEAIDDPIDTLGSISPRSNGMVDFGDDYPFSKDMDVDDTIMMP